MRRNDVRAFLTTMVAAMLGCGAAIAAAFGIWFFVIHPNGDHLADDVLASMNQFISDNKDLRETGIHVASVTVLYGSGNLYEGQATMADGTAEREVPVHVAYDGDTMLWNTDPGAFLPIRG